MCGLAAILSYGTDAPPVDPDELLAIREAMIARGPDGAGLWMSPERRVGLAHRRLSLLDLSEAGAQPMANEDGSLRILFNGEIYNYRELRRRLEAKDFRFRSHSDTEVLLHLYADKGVAMVHELRGMYAFAIWDGHNRRLFAARDPLGIKPLYYADDGRQLRIASQVKPLLAGRAISPTPDPVGQTGFLLLGYVPEPFTIHQSVRALPAGAFLVAEQDGRPCIRSFCRIEDELASAAADRTGDASVNVRERLRAALADSVDRHLVACVPVGVFLSAGLDSGVITALAAESSEDLRTITLGFSEYRGKQCDETTLARTVAASYGTGHETRWISRREFQEDFERVLTAMDQPSIDGVNTYFVAKAAREAGLKAALSGIGGDELLGGYPSFVQVPKLAEVPARRLGWLGRAVRIASERLLGGVASPKYAALLEYAGTWGGAYLLRRSLFMPWEIPRILDPDIACEGLQGLQITHRLEETVSAISSPQLKISALEMVWYMRNQLLRDSDWAGMANSVEIRTPLADTEVVRAVAPIVAQGRLRAGKRDLAEVPSRPLPRAILERNKTGFAVPVREWISQIDRGTRGRGLRGWALRLAREFEFTLTERA